MQCRRRSCAGVGPCAVLPDYQGTGAGSAAIRAGLDAAKQRGENLIVVLGHADFYPRFGFTAASGFGVTAPFEVSDSSFLALGPNQVTPCGEIKYATAFGM